jgi:hypothetical protein
MVRAGRRVNSKLARPRLLGRNLAFALIEQALEACVEPRTVAQGQCGHQRQPGIVIAAEHAFPAFEQALRLSSVMIAAVRSLVQTPWQTSPSASIG